MKPILSYALVLGLLAGCATPKPNPLSNRVQPDSPVFQLESEAPSDCARLQADVARVSGEKRVALEKQQNAWKAVVPFAVVAKNVSGRSAAAEADRKLVKLREAQTQKGCSIGAL